MVKRLTQCLLAALTVVLFSMVSSVAAQNGGTITGTGKIYVDNVLVQNGAKLQNNSAIFTDADGEAVVDLGAVGKITMRPNTILKLNLSPTANEVAIERCGSTSFTVPQGVTMRVVYTESKRTQIMVRQGEIAVEHANKKSSLAAVHNRDFYDTKVVTNNAAKGESVFTVNCCQCCFVEKANPNP
jgi:hypothetical protein